MKVPLTNNLKLQHAITYKMTDTWRKNFIFILSDSIGLQNFTEIQGGQLYCYVDLTWYDSKHTNSKYESNLQA
jgi:hypothetical protein